MSEVNYIFGHSYLEVNKNNTKSKEYFWAQMQSDQTLTRGYIAKTSSQRCNSRGLRLKKLEVRGLAAAEANSRG